MDYQNIDTSRIEHLSDEELLIQIKGMELYPGWGLVAELAKRFEEIIDG